MVQPIGLSAVTGLTISAGHLGDLFHNSPHVRLDSKMINLAVR